MLLIAIAFIGGVFTILSPCILPVVPFVFARNDRPFLSERLPLLLGLAGTFALVTCLGSAGIAGAFALSQYGRYLALGLLATFGTSLLFPGIATRLMRPLSRVADTLMAQSQGKSASGKVISAVLIGVATGLLWAPCAGPILGAVLSGAAIHGTSWETAASLVAYGLGAACSLAIVMNIGKRATDRLKRSLGLSEHLRKFTGALVLLAVGAVATGVDVPILAAARGLPTDSVEGKLVKLIAPRPSASRSACVQNESCLQPAAVAAVQS